MISFLLLALGPICSSQAALDVKLGCFHVLAIANSAAMITEYMCLFKSWFSLDRCPGVGLLDQMVRTITAGEGVGKREPYYTVGGNVNWCNHCGKLYGNSSEN